MLIFVKNFEVDKRRYVGEDIIVGVIWAGIKEQMGELMAERRKE